MAQTLLVKGRTLVLALVVAALATALSAGPAAADVGEPLDYKQAPDGGPARLMSTDPGGIVWELTVEAAYDWDSIHWYEVCRWNPKLCA
jgi:hypothetical protein